MNKLLHKRKCIFLCIVRLVLSFMKKQFTFVFALFLSLAVFAGNGEGEWLNLGPENGREQTGVLEAPYPNPATTMAYLQYELPAMQFTGELRIYSLIGQQVKQIRLENPMGEVEIPTHDLKSGIYFVYLVVDGKKLTSRKMVVSH